MLLFISIVGVGFYVFFLSALTWPRNPIFLLILKTLSLHHSQLGSHQCFQGNTARRTLGPLANLALQIDLLILPQGVLQSALTCRIILNIRGASRRGVVTELHVDIPIAFAPMARDTDIYGVELETYGMENSVGKDPV